MLRVHLADDGWRKEYLAEVRGCVFGWIEERAQGMLLIHHSSPAEDIRKEGKKRVPRKCPFLPAYASHSDQPCA